MDDAKKDAKHDLDMPTEVKKVNVLDSERHDREQELDGEKDGDVYFTTKKVLLVMTCTATMILNVSRRFIHHVNALTSNLSTLDHRLLLLRSSPSRFPPLAAILMLDRMSCNGSFPPSRSLPYVALTPACRPD
jgi:hypothetical protein